jgi:hypothetical protein
VTNLAASPDDDPLPPDLRAALAAYGPDREPHANMTDRKTLDALRAALAGPRASAEALALAVAYCMKPGATITRATRAVAFLACCRHFNRTGRSVDFVRLAADMATIDSFVALVGLTPGFDSEDAGDVFDAAAELAPDFAEAL